MTIELALILGIIACMVVIFFLGEIIGGMRIDRKYTKQREESQASKFRNFEARMDRWDERQGKIDESLSKLDLTTIGDATLQQLWQDPTNLNVSTDPTSVESSIGTKKPL